MNKRLCSALVLTLFACASLLLVAPAQAQSVYGSIFGTVTDASGAAIPGATITVKDESKGTVVTATSNASGDYSVPHLIPDVYDMKVTAKGFQNFEATSITVLADTAPRIDPTMQVGGSATTITVNANQEPELKTATADVSTVFNQQQVSSLPVGDQNFTNLQLLLPGAQLLGWSHAADENPQGSRQIQIDGQAFGGTAFELDGTDNQDPILGIIVINPTMDAVTETKITTQNFDAEFGKAVSAVVTAQTRSGTNSFHGDVYDFRTGNANLARDPYTQAPLSVTEANGQSPSIPPGLKNRFGGSIGGPIKKDKAFFFFNYEGQRQKVGTSASDTLPTSNLTESCLGNTLGSGSGGIAGCDFSEYKQQLPAAGILYDTSQPTYTGTDGKQHYPEFQNNVIPTSYLSPQAMALLTYLEPFTKGINYVSGTTSVAQANLDSNYHASGTGLFNSNQWTERADYTLSEKAHAFERFSRFTDVLSGGVMFGDAGGPGFGIGNYGGNSNGANDSLASGMDIALSPTLLTDFRLGYYRYNVIDSKHDQSTEFANTLNIPGINTGTYFTGGSPGFFITNLPGGTGGGYGNTTSYGDGLNVDRCNCPLTEREDQFQIVNNWTKIVGNHTLKMGVDLRYGRNLRVPSDNDRAGLLNFADGPTSDPNSATQGGLGFATFFLGDVTSFNRYVSTSTNAKEFQKRTFFYGQDTWRATRNLTLNLGLRWDLYFPESVNAAGNGSLLSLKDGYLHVAGIGGVPSNMGWTIRKTKQFEPRIGMTYQVGNKTVIRAGYGRSFDTGVFGSVFGHTVTQNLPVLANQQINAPGPTEAAFTLTDGPMAYVSPVVPSSGLLPNPGASVASKARPNPLNFPTIDAWNLSVQRALTPTMTLTVAYVGNKGTHTLGDGDGNSTNPNEAAIFLPGPNSFTGQTLHYDPTASDAAYAGDSSAALWDPSTGAVGSTNLLQRYYAAQLIACSDPNYTSPGSGYDNVALPVGGCGWTNSIQYNGNNQNTEFDALQITLAQQMSKGLSYTLNYQWGAAWDEQTGYYTWDHNITHGRDANLRKNQITLYGSYDLPFGHGKQFVPSANRMLDELIGGYQLSGVMSLSSGQPFTLGYNESGSNVPGSAPNWPSANHGQRMKTSLTGYTGSSSGTGSRQFYQQQIPCADTENENCTSGASGSLTDPIDVAASTGVFKNPGLDTIGNAGRNTYWGPGFFNADLAITKAFTIRENLVTKFRMDAYNAFNHINAGNPGGGIESAGTITGEAPGGSPRQLEFSLRVQF